MKKVLASFALTAACAMAANVTGYVIDQACADKPAMRGNVQCAESCMKKGSPAVLVTDEGKVYKFTDQAKVADHAGQKVTVTGKVEGDTITVASVK
jgi:streptogramin lyase